MTAIVLPDIDRATIDELRKRIPNLSEIEVDMPSLETMGRRADETIDRVLGRSRGPSWPWVALGVAVVAVIGFIAAYAAWLRTPSVAPGDATWTDAGTTTEADLARTEPAYPYGSAERPGLTAAESSLSSAAPGEEL